MQDFSIGTTLHTITHAGRERRYLVHLPPMYDRNQRWPLVFSFHGSNSNGQTQLEFTDINPLADREGFIVIYPFGTGDRERLRFWNAGNCCGYPVEHDVDDVGFIRSLLDHLQSTLSIHQKRIYATGMSNGGMFAYRLANEMADTFAAIAPVAGVMGFAHANPARPVSVIHFHGSDDEFVPIDGGVGKQSVTGTSHFSLQYTIDQWRQANHCPAEPVSVTLPSKTDHTTTIRTTYGPGDEGTEVVLYLVEGAGHTWPGRPPRPHYLGHSTNSFSANAVMWEFFCRHART
ncbi:MAG: PHB depolymerase family esterase [Planctomycetota bacterium]|nr:PHB depolymerase family esterase [Planctomycetota bacterium]